MFPHAQHGGHDDNKVVSYRRCCVRLSFLAPPGQTRHERRQHVLLLAATTAGAGAVALQIDVDALHLRSQGSEEFEFDKCTAQVLLLQSGER